MKLYLISSDSTIPRHRYLVAAAETRDLEVVVLDPTAVALPLEHWKERALLYRIDTGKEAAILEALLIQLGHFTTFRHEGALPRMLGKAYNDAERIAAGVSSPRSVYVNNPTRQQLQQTANDLGFPIVLKAASGKEGKGVALISSMTELQSVTDVLGSNDVAFYLQEYLPAARGHSIRAVVLGDEILVAYEKTIENAAEFRSNAGAATRRLITPDERMTEMALAACRARGTYFGGVDFMYRGEDDPVIAEVNFPCNFAASQDFTGIDIAGRMIDFLLEKNSLTRKHANATSHHDGWTNESSTYPS